MINKRIKVLFDESVRIDGERKTKQKGWKQKEIDCLGAVAQFCREKRIVPYTTDELYAEYFRGKTFPSRPYKKDVFQNIKFETVPCPIKRSKWGISMKQYMDKQEVITFCRVFLRLSSAGIEKYISDVKKNPNKSLTAFEEKCLRNLNIFRKICDGIDETHYPDAFHLWTAEENELDVFLTTEKTFFKNVMNRQKVKLNCQIMFPSELIKAAP